MLATALFDAVGTCVGRRSRRGWRLAAGVARARDVSRNDAMKSLRGQERLTPGGGGGIPGGSAPGGGGGRPGGGIGGGGGALIVLRGGSERAADLQFIGRGRRNS